MSSGLDRDARAALHRFRREAREFGVISNSLAEAARAATSAYAAALRAGDEQHWGNLVTAVAALVRQARSYRDLVGLHATEADALAHFEAIVDENTDLLAPFARPATADAAYRYRVWAAGVATAPPRREHSIALS